PRVSALLAACGASISRSRCSSPSRMVDNDVLQEAGTVRERPDAEVGGERLPEVRKSLTRPYVDPLSNVGSAPAHVGSALAYVGSAFRRTCRAGPARQHDRNIFARMICARRAGIVAMVRRHDEQIRIA